MLSKVNQRIIEAYNKGYRVINNIIYNPKGKILKPVIRKNDGYVQIWPTLFIHKLVAYQKYSDIIFEEGIQVRHLDGNKLNNSDENIVLGNQSQNMMDIPEEQRRINAGNQSRKYEHKEVIDYYSQTGSYKDTMRMFGISSKGTLHFILKKSMATEG